MNERVTIGRYTLRPATEQDHDNLAVWIEGDPDHRDTTKAEFFHDNRPGVQCWAMEDERGYVVLYFRMTSTVRLDIQFGPDETREQRDRNADAMREGFQWMARGMAAADMHEVIFNSTNKGLVRFAEKRLGFSRSPSELRCAVASKAMYRPKQKDETGS